MSIAIARGTPIPAPPIGNDVPTWQRSIAPDLRPIVLPIDYVSQEQDQWCWAACFQMIGSFLNLGAKSQLAMATQLFGRAACVQPNSPQCNRAAFPDEAVNKLGLTCSVLEHALDSREVRAYLGAGPIEVAFEAHLPGGSRSHVALITAVGPGDQVLFLDPWPAFGRSSPRLEQLSAHYHWGPWIRSYVQFAAL